MPNIVVVGCGDHYQTNLFPSLNRLVQNGVVKLLATIDLEGVANGPRSSLGGVPHHVRGSDQSLAGVAEGIKGADKNDTVFLLAHDHAWHTKDTCDLLNHGYKVILEKPYGLTIDETQCLRKLLNDKPRRIALAEYYLMMKTVPLLDAANLLDSHSFLRESPYLEQLSDTPLGNIGTLRMVQVDILEGEGDTGQLEHRGRHFADNRVGIGMILDLGIHALAPLISLEGSLGALRTHSRMDVRTAVCQEYLDFVGHEWQIPSLYVPETYAEIRLHTDTGVPIEIRVGKYTLPDMNQRRILLVGDRGEAVLDLSSNELQLRESSTASTPIARSPKNDNTKYVAVLETCIRELNDVHSFTFDASDVSLRANELAIKAHEIARGQTATRPVYRKGTDPSDILIAVPSGQISPTFEEQKLYYEHQYRRMEALESDSFRMSSLVFILTSAALALSTKEQAGASPMLTILILIMLSANILAVLYLIRVNDSIRVHQKRAKSVLSVMSPSMAVVDRAHPQSWVGRFRGRLILQFLLHVFLIVAGGLILWKLGDYPLQVISSTNCP